MLPSPLLQFLSATSFLLLSGRSVLADSGPVPLTVHPQKPRAATCSKGKGLLGSSCSVTVDHKTYCSRYLSYCSSFPSSIGDVSDRDGFQAYCSETSKLNSCRQFGNKGPTATGKSGSGVGRRYDDDSGFDSDFGARADETGNVTAGNLDVDTSDSVWYAVEITVGSQSESVAVCDLYEDSLRVPLLS